MKILHLSDFHLNKDTLTDWREHIKDSLINKLKTINFSTKVDFVAFTGDLIDKGGKDLGGAEAAFKIFNMEIIIPILESLNITIDKFYIIPGNHDIVRTADSEREELGNQSYFTSEPKISAFISDAISNEDYSGIKRIYAYKKFESELYATVNSRHQSVFESSFIVDINNQQVGVCCLNSAWRCYDANDFRKILIGEKQLTLNLNFIKDCPFKIALMHHQFDWLSPIEKKIVSNRLIKEFDLILTGHVHESDSNGLTGFAGSTFVNIAPSGLNDIRSDSRTISTGFSVVNTTNTGFLVDYYRYNHNTKEYVLNTDAGNTGLGTSEFFFPTAQSDLSLNLVETVLTNIRNDHFKEMDDHYIGVKAEVNNLSIKDSFVFPPIDQGTHTSALESKDELLTIQGITKSKDNLMFFGISECGKTSLLYRLVQEYVDEYHLLQKIPVYISFGQIGNKDIATVIKSYLTCSSEQVRSLLEEKKIILLIDNLVYKGALNNLDQLKRIQKFRIDNDVQIIATSEHDIAGIIPTEHMSLCRIPFNYYFIKGLRTKEIKTIMKQWIPNEDEQRFDEKLEKLVDTFYSYSLPNTAMAVSLYLWSLDNKERKPINQAVLMEIYIEIVLEKLNKENIYRDNFDFTNKLQLIAKIAQEMLISGDGINSITCSDFFKIIEEYFKLKVGFNFDSQIIAEYLFDRKIFVKTDLNRVKFSYKCFFHFFIAKRMAFDRSFRAYIISENEYFKFPKEIDYYTGLTRSDIELFEIIFKRFEDLFKPTEIIFKEVNVDDYFTIKDKNGKEAEPIARNVEIAKIKDSRPSEEKNEEIYDEQLSKIEHSGTLSTQNDSLSFDRVLLIMCNVLRNSEGIENLELKKKAYDSVIKYNITYAILYTQWVIRYVLQNHKLPLSIPANISLTEILKNMPFIIQNSLNYHVGTSKLENVILSKINDDRRGKSFTKSELEAYFSVTLYADIQGHNFNKVLKDFIKQIKSLSVKNYLFFKLKSYYYKRTKPGSSNEELYLDLLSDLQIRSQNLPKAMKGRIIKKLKEQRGKVIDLFNQ